MPHPFKDWSLHVSLGGPSAVRKDMRAVVQMASARYMPRL